MRRVHMLAAAGQHNDNTVDHKENYYAEHSAPHMVNGPTVILQNVDGHGAKKR